MEPELVAGCDAGQLDRLRELAGRLWGWSSRWHPGELSAFWWEHGGPLPSWRVATWVRGGRTVAWAWSRYPGRLDLQLDPAHLDLLPRVLAWPQDEPSQAITVLDAESALLDALTGWEPAAGGTDVVHLRRDLREVEQAAVPAGFVLRPVRGTEDAQARGAVHARAFGAPAADYAAVMGAPGYRPRLDQMVVAPDGTPAAFCLAWLDEVSGVVALEPVGTDPRFRRRGLARAAVLGALAAAAALGATHARVCARDDPGAPGARATYESVGFRRYARNVRLVRPA